MSRRCLELQLHKIPQIDRNCYLRTYTYVYQPKISSSKFLIEPQNIVFGLIPIL